MVHSWTVRASSDSLPVSGFLLRILKLAARLGRKLESVADFSFSATVPYVREVLGNRYPYLFRTSRFDRETSSLRAKVLFRLDRTLTCAKQNS